MRWKSLTLRAQVTTVVLACWVFLEIISVVVDISQIHQARLEELKNRGDGFLREVITALERTPQTQRAEVARSFNNAERSVIVGPIDAAARVTEGQRRPELASWFLKRLEANGLAVKTVSVAERIVSDQEDGFGQSTGLGGFQPDAASEMPQRPSVGVYSVQLEDDVSWINCYLLLAPETFWPLLFSRSVDSLIGAVLIVLLALLIGHVMRPLNALSENAERLGRGQVSKPLVEDGSVDIRNTIIAFNRMQARISQALEYKTALLRSLGHDLKGPLARLKDAIDESEPETTRQALENRLDVVTEIVSSVTTFISETHSDGEIVRIDLPSLVEVLVEEQLDAGRDATFESAEGLIVSGRHNALMRALRNLIENAVKYGGRAQVKISKSSGMAVVHVDDDGPGIPPEQVEAAFEPFQRLGASGPGSGLGLSIVRAIVIDQGGSVTLQNRPGGGLRASVQLPLDTGAQPARKM